MALEDHLVLNRFFQDLMGVDGFDTLQADLRSQEEGAR